MKKIAVFGKPGSGKSTFSKKLASVTGIQLHQLDSIVYNSDGSQVDSQTYHEKHQNILVSDSWIIDGFGPIASFNKRLDAADTLIYINLPYTVSYWLVTKRLLKGLFIKPEGWPAGSSVLKGSIASYKMLKLSPTFWHGDFLQQLEKKSPGKSVYVIRSLAQLNHFIDRHVKPQTTTNSNKITSHID
ncbi:topology modulation protein [Thalassotalea insulae]|uniref:Topology modulation protein n=1 Tax=Thalassotalea insulae TaxID=2056778 RepID=A0ABQ6GVB7_9GAMM|nr:adenylate kinase [Thalassotalea insulae]GLX78587.1 topology modulation protein [Thalassotalea insulae]